VKINQVSNQYFNNRLIVSSNLTFAKKFCSSLGDVGVPANISGVSDLAASP
jgi:hypothetical protein